ncbi:hypothetical protein AVEN_214179-1 [Araneus ventricosus]|uniref:Fibrinogen C-terminal domain-containing protein n=1 Tax=Araneus ventricosus TaxID=182803 RepID=A0A4Y2FW25_ARAVE|nr:hypothetical protein AVEN_214179-1 [Araneus ventricosus]
MIDWSSITITSPPILRNISTALFRSIVRDKKNREWDFIHFPYNTQAVDWCAKKRFYTFCAYFFSFLAIIYAAGHKKSDCLEKEKALALLETAEDLLTKAGDSFPTCEENANSTDQSECGSEKPLAYVEISKKLISEVREHFPTCPEPIVEERKKSEKPSDCSEILASGSNKSGVYTIWPGERNATGKPLKVYCDMETEGGGWTVILVIVNVTLYFHYFFF